VWHRLLHPYSLLLLLSVSICAVQVYLGLSFFKSPVVHPGPVSSPLVTQSDPAEFPCSLPKDAISAAKRAKTEECRNQIIDLSCKIENGYFYPQTLPRYCTATRDAELAGRRIGCFKDEFSARILQGYLFKDKVLNSPTTCVSKCAELGFSYAGLQFGLECFCGNKSPKPDQKLTDVKCNKPCPGAEDTMCGGYLTMDVFHTGLTPLVPAKLGSINPSAPPVKVVFLLTVNGRALRQILRLIHRLDGPGSFFYIHVDARQDYLHRELSNLARGRTNVRMAKTRFSTIWGGASLLSMLLSCMQELLEIVEWDWDFVLNLSESDYIVKTRESLFTFLSSNRGSNFVKSHGREAASFIKKQGLDKTFFQCEHRMWRLGPRNLPMGIQMDGGSDWICLNREFSTYVVESRDGLMTGLRQFFNYTLLPAESFFHTVLQNSGFCTTYINNNLHLTNWKRKQGCKCQYKAVVDWCGCSPNDFLSDDWTKLEQTESRQLYFARKFEPIIHADILDRLDDKLGLSHIRGLGERGHYWQNLFDHRDSYPVQATVFYDLVNTLASVFVKSMSGDMVLDKVLEVTVYRVEDMLDSFLVLIMVNHPTTNQMSRLELRVVLVDHAVPPPLASPATRLLAVDVGTDFDPKELIFRNFLKLNGQNSDVGLRLHCATGQKEVVELRWLDPSGRVAGSNQLVLPASTESSVEHYSLNSSLPLRPGTWTITRRSQGGEETGEPVTRFLVLPDPDTEVQEDGHEDVLQLQEGLDSRTLWLQRQVAAFYTVVDSCTLDQHITELKRCEETSWSSRRFDVADLANINLD